MIDYSKPKTRILSVVINFILGFAFIAVVVWFFYKLLILSIIAGIIGGCINLVLYSENAVKKRKLDLRNEFYSMLEFISVGLDVSMSFKNALEKAKTDIGRRYSEDDSDMFKEIKHMLDNLSNNINLSDSFIDLAERSKIEDIKSFALVYKTIENSADKNEIVRQIKDTIEDKADIEREIDSLLNSGTLEANIMLVMPILIIGIASNFGNFMDKLYTSAAGRICATVGIAIYIASFFMSRKFRQIDI